jgi:exosortase
MAHGRTARGEYPGSRTAGSGLVTTVQDSLVITASTLRRRMNLQKAFSWLQFGAIALLVGLIYAPVLQDLALDWWTQDNLSYGLLIPPLAVYVAWARRRMTFSEPAIPNARGLWLIATACLQFLLGKLAAEFFISRISFVVLLVALTWTFWGSARLRSLAFPFLLLATMVPLPVILYNAISAPLQLLASDVATNLAQGLGVTVYRDGNIINLAHVSLGVEEACSGLNSLSALAVGGILLGYLQCTRFRTRALLFAITIPLAIAINVLRVTGTAVIADYHEEFALGFYHSFSGWLVFVVCFGILQALAKGLHLALD